MSDFRLSDVSDRLMRLVGVAEALIEIECSVTDGKRLNALFALHEIIHSELDSLHDYVLNELCEKDATEETETERFMRGMASAAGED